MLTLFLVAGTVYFTGQQLKQSIEATKASTRSADAASGAFSVARESLRAATRQSQIDQRAWVGPFEIAGLPEIGKPVVITIKFKNSGKTPALDVSPYLTYQFVKKGEHGKFTFRRLHSKEMIAPNADATGVIPIPNGVWSALDDERTRNKLITLNFYGKVWYSDIFKREHWLEFCYFLEPIGTQYVFTSCNEHNETDQNY